MEVIGTIFKISDNVKSGISPKTGKQWAMRDIVVAVDEPYVSKTGEPLCWRHTMLFTLGTDSAMNFSLDVGTKVKIRYASECKEYNGRFYETKMVRSIELTA